MAQANMVEGGEGGMESPFMYSPVFWPPMQIFSCPAPTLWHPRHRLLLPLPSTWATTLLLFSWGDGGMEPTFYHHSSHLSGGLSIRETQKTWITVQSWAPELGVSLGRAGDSHL